MEVMTDNSACLPRVEVVLSGAVTLETMHPILRCLRQLLGGTGAYLIRAEEVTQIDLEAAELLLGFVSEVIRRGAIVRWAAASRNLINTARAIAADHAHVGLAALAG